MSRQSVSQMLTSQQKPAMTQSGLLQRKCACGNHAPAGGECAECAKKETGLQRKLAIGTSNDPLEREADRVADQVVANSTASSSVSSTAFGRLQRQDAPKEGTNQEKYKEGLEKLSKEGLEKLAEEGLKKLPEAFLKTPLGKELLEKIKQDTLVKGATELGKDFISTWPGMIVTGAAAIGAVAALAATHKELPAQIPEIPLDVLTPGLSVQLTYKGPVDKPTEAMITFKFTEHIPKDRSDKKPTSETDKFRAGTARLAAEDAKFRAGMTFKPGSPEDLQQKAEQEAIRRAFLKYSGGPDIEATIKKYPWLATPEPKSGLQLTMPKPSFGIQPPSLFGDEFKLKLPGEQKKKQNEPELQKKLSIGASNDPPEEEADRVAEQVLAAPTNPAVSGATPSIQRYTGQPSGQSEEVPASVGRALGSSGKSLEPALRQDMEQRFGHDFSRVQVHFGVAAEQSARDVNAHAYTVGHNIVFGRGQYTPHTHEGRRLLAHELTHVVQQAHSEHRLQRFSYEEFKEKAYSGLISGLRTAKKVALDALRSQVGRLPRQWWGAANTIISIIDEVLGVIETLILAVIGLVVGFGEGVVGLVKGLITLGYGVLKLLYDLVVGIFTNFDELKQDMGAIVNALKNLPSTLKKMVTDWLDRFNKASLERQSLMIGELFGQIEALIASFAVAASRAGSVATVAEAGGEVGAAGAGAATTDVLSTGAQATRPALTVIRGGGDAATTAARASAPAFEGSAALKVAPLLEEAPAAAPLRLVPPAPVEGVAGATVPQTAATGARSKALAAAIAAAAAAEKAGKGKKPTPLNTMRFQVQWGTGQGGPTFALPAVAPANPGVTTAQAVATLWATVGKVTPAAAQTAAEPAAAKQQAWILNRPPAGIGPGVIKRSEYFPYLRYTDARVDVENLRGQNLRV